MATARELTPPVQNNFKMCVIPSEHLKVLNPVGHGSYSVVDHSHWFNPGYQLKDVAVKVFNHPASKEFLIEGGAFKKLEGLDSAKFPNIVKCYGYNKAGGIQHDGVNYLYGPYLVLEYMKEGSLHNALEHSKTKFSWNEILRLSFEIAVGIDSLHRAGIIHLDIKTENILLGSDNSVRIADLGLANQQDGVGTPYFVAPETIVRECRVANAQKDIYSFGLVLLNIVNYKGFLNCVHSSPPLLWPSYYQRESNGSGESKAEKILNQVLNDAPCPTDCPLEQFENFKKLIQQCLSYEPEKRISMTNILETLKELRLGKKINLQVDATIKTPSSSLIMLKGLAKEEDKKPQSVKSKLIALAQEIASLVSPKVTPVSQFRPAPAIVPANNAGSQQAPALVKRH